VVTELSRQTDGVFADSQNAGNLGGELFRRFTVTFDYASSKVYLARNSVFDAPFKANRSGLAVDSQNGAQIVRDVVAESPGTEAGIAAGDVIRAVNGTPVDKIPSWEMNEILRREPGTKVRLRVQATDKTERETVLTLRDLI
jgi:C-terminal processing protease CtpA/Prc